jgi:hypothetical protein
MSTAVYCTLYFVRTSSLCFWFVGKNEFFFCDPTQRSFIARTAIAVRLRNLMQELRGAGSRKPQRLGNALHRDALEFIVNQGGNLQHLLLGKATSRTTVS